MFNLVLVGLNHRTARVDIRQRASFDGELMRQGLRRLSSMPRLLESAIVSTCNRVEILSCVEAPQEGTESIEAFLADHSGFTLTQLKPLLYRYVDEQAVRHLFRVASSLDSMILGEPQILGQIKSCYGLAEEEQTLGSHLKNLFQAAFRTAKRVRTETSIGEYPVSVSSAAVELVHKIFGNLKEKSILIVGAGKMGEAAIRHLAESGAKSIYVANRSLEAARVLAERFKGTAVDFQELFQWIVRADIVLTSTAAQETLIDLPMVLQVMRERGNAPLVFIDIAVPRNVDPEVGTIENVFHYDIDDLGAVVEANLHERVKAAGAAEKIVDQEVRAFYGKLKSMDMGPVVLQVQGQIEEICRTELQRYFKKTGPQEAKQIRELEQMISRIAAKIAHPLVVQLRNGEDPHGPTDYADLIKRLFATKNSE